MLSRACCIVCFGALLCLCILAVPAQVSAQTFTQFLTVDCSNPSAPFPTISSALAYSGGNNTYIYVTPGNTCTENINIGYLNNVAISTDWLRTFNVMGNVSILSSRTVEIQGMIVTNSVGNGIDVSASSDVTLTFVQSINNAGAGLTTNNSAVTIGGAGAFSNNGGIGINAGSNSMLTISPWNSNVDISNNVTHGVNLDRSEMGALGPLTITGNRAAPGGTSPNGFGINEFGGSKATLFALFGPVSIASNDGGGISLWETSELSTGGNVSWAPYLETIQGNGPVGISANYGTSLTLIGGVTISDHATAGLSLYGNSQATFLNSNLILHNATGTDPERAGIVVDNGSQALVSGASIQNNQGPGILGLMHATLDVEGSTFASNAAGAIVCDSSTALETDLARSALGSANACVVSAPGIHHQHTLGSINSGIPDWRRTKARSLKISPMSSTHRPAPSK